MKEPDITRDKVFKILPGTMPSVDTGVQGAYDKYPTFEPFSADDDVLMADWGQSEGTRQATDEFKYNPKVK